ncbi:MAG: caspase family protein [Rhizobiaceae bacterium]
MSLTLRTLVRTLLIAMLLVWQSATSWAAVYPGGGGDSAWLVIASRDNSNAAIAMARRYASKHPSVGVFLSSNGWYAISLGWASKSRGESLRRGLVSEGGIPSDSYFHSGERFIELIWSASGVRGRNRNSILAATKLDTSSRSNDVVDSGNYGRGYVTGLSRTGDNYLSFRSGPSTSNRELLRLSESVSFDIIGRSGRWYRVRLNNGRTGWVYGKYVALEPVQVVEAPKKRPTPAEPEKPKKIEIDDSSNGLKLQVSGLSAAGFDYLSMRGGPGNKYPELARLREKTKLVVTGKHGDWFQVRPAPSVEGWVNSKYVIAADVPTFGPDDETEIREVVAVVPDKPKPDLSSRPSRNDDNAVQGDQRRVALILGNSKYENTTVLANPKNDADRIARELRNLGFEVVLGLDRNKQGMESSIREFVTKLPGSDVALFFYAGHAMQVNGQNYLIPVDAKLEDSTAIDFETINLASILSFVDQPGRISIALLDACRDNPLSRRFARSLGATRSAFLGRGLANPTSAGNLLIGFATAPGEVALDGEGENSPFTTALLDHIATPGLEIEAMLKRVRSDVFDSTDKQQSPWVNSGLRREFYFKPKS